MDDEMRKFNSDITKTLREFRSAISSLDADKVRRCLQVYVNALDGNDEDDKFVRHFRGLLKKKVGDHFKERFRLRTRHSNFRDNFFHLFFLQKTNSIYCLSLFGPIFFFFSFFSR